MSSYINVEGLKVARCLFDFVESEAIPGTGLDTSAFWRGFATLLNDLAPLNKRLLDERLLLQSSIDDWHQQHDGSAIKPGKYREFLETIAYLLPQPATFSIETDHVDVEIASMPGPQLVVPVMNARFALNAANARWGSLYDALYGTDAIAERDGAERGAGYNEIRGQKVIARGREFLDSAFALQDGSHFDAQSYCVENGSLVIALRNTQSQLIDPKKFVGFKGEASSPDAIFLRNHALHVELRFDREHAIGRSDAAGIADIVLESAITTIMDAEDSVAAVDAEDKTLVYRNWLGLMKGDLVESFDKDGTVVERRLADDKEFIDASGQATRLSGRSLMLIRNVGHLMSSNAVLLTNGEEVPEGLMDATLTVLIAMHDLQRKGPLRNSREGSVYIVKPKMHGPDEVRFAVETFARVEALLGLEANTIKIGIMDEERRTTLNLRACIEVAKDRVIFINTGFLDRTGDEIHTSMHAGPMVRKDDIKDSAWIAAYEDANVDAGLSSGFQGRAQIGKGMWAKPDKMLDMMKEKVAHPLSGANTAWTPSPTAATLHALHYHDVDVLQRQTELATRDVTSIDDILKIPLAEEPNWSDAEVEAELENNAQGILGYVVRWVQQGVGCSKVPDINNVGLMEDRATLRISSQHIANWLLHGVCSKEQVMAALKRMAAKVDAQNHDDPVYQNMMPDIETSIAFQAACDLVFKGVDSPNGYTEPFLHARRVQYKTSQS